VRDLFGTTYHIRPVFAARNHDRVKKQLGDDHARALRSISIPPLAERRQEIPRLLDEILVNEHKSPRLATELKKPALDALSAKAYPRNLDDLRAQADRLFALMKNDFNKSAAADALGISVQAVSEWMDRLEL
jgi:transcriptional regulator with PAS, ATPase and Fis domain